MVLCSGEGGGDTGEGTTNKGYSLEALSKALVPNTAKNASMKELFGEKK